MRILAVNEGSSSLKLSVIGDGDETLAAENIALGDATDTVALGDGAESDARADSATRRLIATHGPIDAAGHRIVHGGTEFTGPVLLDASSLERIRALTDLAPLHQPGSLHGLELVSRVLPDVPAVGCFDTAFHAHMPAEAATYALPEAWRTRWPLRRFGFHGLSHAWASTRVARLLQRDIRDLRTVTCHLGSGASLCAVDRGQSVDTTMGFTPLEGLVMSTRSGTVDPGLVLWLQQHAGVSSSELSETLERHSGLLGLAGSADMRAVVAAATAGDQKAVLAIDVYVHRLRAEIAAMVAAMSGLDVLVFTGGVGEGSSEMRARTARGLGFLGVQLDAARNLAAHADADIGASDAALRAFVITAREDLEIAAQVRSVLATVHA